MKKYYKVLIIPLIVVYWVVITEIMDLVSQPSDRAVVLGVIYLSLLTAVTIYLINLYKKLKKNEKN